MKKQVNNLVIIGAGRNAREVFSWASQAITSGAPWRIKGFLDNRPQLLASYPGYPPILGTVEDYPIQEEDIFLCALGEPKAKQLYSSKMLARGGSFVSLLHPGAVIGKNVEVGMGSIVGPFVELTCDLKLGNFVTIGMFSVSGHDTRVGDWSTISGHCGLNGGVQLEEGVFVGTHAAILPDVHVGAWAYVGAGSIVLRNVKPGVKVFGNPALPIGTVEGPGQLA